MKIIFENEISFNDSKGGIRFNYTLKVNVNSFILRVFIFIKLGFCNPEEGENWICETILL